MRHTARALAAAGALTPGEGGGGGGRCASALGMCAADASADARGRVPLPLLREAAAYVPTTFDYAAGKLPLGTWTAVFRASIASMTQRASLSRQCSGAVPDAFEPGEIACETTGELKPAATRAKSFGARFERELQRIESSGESDCLSLCAIRDRCLREAGFPDAFASVKAEEDARALALLPGVLEELDALAAAGDEAAHCEALLRGCFAGNIFDLGAKATVDMYEAGDMSFASARDKLLPRPWCVDCLDEFKAKWTSSATPWKKAIVFVDNAGADMWLGMYVAPADLARLLVRLFQLDDSDAAALSCGVRALTGNSPARCRLPLCRALARRGTKVVIASNHTPSLNDMTAAELKLALPRVHDEQVHRLLECGMLSVVDSGSDDPVIDLSKISRELAEAAADADLVVLEGMGRGIETNLNAELTCDRLNLGMVKHPEVAESLGGRLYDVVCKYVPRRGH